jgi:hypothetical protein
MLAMFLHLIIFTLAATGNSNDEHGSNDDARASMPTI